MSDTLNLIAQASYNEEGGLSKGLQGDQNGIELNARQWFSYPWKFIYRARDEETREKIADFMEKAISNGFIGYDSGEKRRTLFLRLQENGYNIEEINTACACDCASLVYCAVYGATGIEMIPVTEDVEKENGTIEQVTFFAPCVRHYETYLMQECADFGFTKLTDSKYIESGENLLRGDLLVAPGYHIAAWI